MTTLRSRLATLPGFATLVLLTACVAALTGCKKESADSGSNAPAVAAGGTDFGGPAPADALELTFAYGSEKKDWINDCTAAFNAEQHKTSGGKPIFVRPIAMGSGESVDEVLEGRTRAHLISPASGVFITLGNAKYRATANVDLVAQTENLVVSPVVIAMWEPMAKALGWPEKPIGWRDILELAKNREGWASKGHAEWGAFRFGHTHPEYSNSGMISVLATLYAASGKSRDLTSDDLAKPETAAFLHDIEQAVVHYGSSTGFFADKMFENGPGYLSAAVLYESSVIDARNRPQPTAFPVVAIYPKEGTFWSDHPVGIVNREWVTAAHKDACKVYIDYLRAAPQQQKAMKYGFRPGDTSVAVSAPIDGAHGVNPDEPKATLPVPPAAVVGQAIELWKKSKKHSNIVLVFDTSGSMNDENRIQFAREGAKDLVNLLGDDDTMSLVPFSTSVNWSERDVLLKNGRATVQSRISGLMPAGQTALYDAIGESYDFLAAKNDTDRISAIVVLTDGADSARGISLEALLGKIAATGERGGIRVFTIAYGSDARKDVLQKISGATKAKSYVGKNDNIRAVFKEIATFF